MLDAMLPKVETPPAHPEIPSLERAGAVLGFLSSLSLIVGVVLTGWWALAFFSGEVLAVTLLIGGAVCLVQWILFGGLAALLRGMAVLLGRYS